MEKKDTDKLTEEFMSELEDSLNWLIELAGRMEKYQFTMRQKSQIAGMMMGISAQFLKINKKLIEWGYLID